MAHLTARDLKKLQDCIREIYSNLNMETFHANMLAAISKVIPASSIGYAEVNISQKRLSKNVVWPLISLSPDEVAAFELHMHEHPLAHLVYPKEFKPNPFKKEINSFRTGWRIADSGALEGKAVKIHDMLTTSQFYRLGIYNEFYRKLNIEHQMVLLLSCKSSLNKNIAVNRDRRDFTEEERLMLNLLAPHITQAFKNASLYAKTQEALTALSIDGNKDASAQSLSSLGLTHREADVLYWVAKGKTNYETAVILKIAPGTVKIHLERIYRKLEVGNRTAAVVKAVEQMANIGCIDAASKQQPLTFDS